MNYMDYVQTAEENAKFCEAMMKISEVLLQLGADPEVIDYDRWRRDWEASVLGTMTEPVRKP